jgi:hypothetical protein
MSDYEALLRKYMRHVVLEEDTTATAGLASPEWTAEERAVLEQMAEDVIGELRVKADC